MKRITNEEMMREIRCTDKNSMGMTTFEFRQYNRILARIMEEEETDV